VRARTPLAIAFALFVTATAVAAGVTQLTPDGIGPLTLGMKIRAAVGTGWLAHRGTGCPLGGKPYPVTYTFTGRKAPGKIRGTAQFDRGALSDLSFTAGVATSTGVTVGKSTISLMVHAYRHAGYKVSSRFVATFAGTFVTVTKKGKPVIQGFAPHRKITTLAIPYVPVCE
jgi:hypothetical protein